MFCTKCGKQIPDGIAFCPHCGVQQDSITTSYVQMQPVMPMRAEKIPYNTMCVLGAVIAGISLILNFFGIVGIAAVIVSVLGLVQIQTKKEKGKELGYIGIGVGTFSIIYALFALLALG